MFIYLSFVNHPRLSVRNARNRDRLDFWLTAKHPVIHFFFSHEDGAEPNVQGLPKENVLTDNQRPKIKTQERTPIEENRPNSSRVSSGLARLRAGRRSMQSSLVHILQAFQIPSSPILGPALIAITSSVPIVKVFRGLTTRLDGPH